MHEPYVVHGSTAQDLRNNVSSLAESIPRDGNIAKAPLLFSISNPMKCAVFGGFSDKVDSPLDFIVDASAWLSAADNALEHIAEAMVNFKMPQQLLTLNQSVYLTFMANDKSVDLLVYYAVRDYEDAALAGDVICFSWAMQRVAFHLGLEVGGYQGMIAQARVRNETPVSDDLYVTESIAPYELDNDFLIEELTMLHNDGAVVGFRNATVRKVVVPIYSAKNALLDTNNPYRFEEALSHLSGCRAQDLRIMCENHVKHLQEQS